MMHHSSASQRITRRDAVNLGISALTLPLTRNTPSYGNDFDRTHKTGNVGQAAKPKGKLNDWGFPAYYRWIDNSRIMAFRHDPYKEDPQPRIAEIQVSKWKVQPLNVFNRRYGLEGTSIGWETASPHGSTIPFLALSPDGKKLAWTPSRTSVEDAGGTIVARCVDDYRLLGSSKEKFPILAWTQDSSLIISLDTKKWRLTFRDHSLKSVRNIDLRVEPYSDGYDEISNLGISNSGMLASVGRRYNVAIETAETLIQLASTTTGSLIHSARHTWPKYMMPWEAILNPNSKSMAWVTFDRRVFSDPSYERMELWVSDLDVTELKFVTRFDLGEREYPVFNMRFWSPNVLWNPNEKQLSYIHNDTFWMVDAPPVK